jgi:hypothetical protein
MGIEKRAFLTVCAISLGSKILIGDCYFSDDMFCPNNTKLSTKFLKRLTIDGLIDFFSILPLSLRIFGNRRSGVARF